MKTAMTMTSHHSMQPDNQYSLKKILIIWALSAIPMGVLAFVITPTWWQLQLDAGDHLLDSC